MNTGGRGGSSERRQGVKITADRLSILSTVSRERMFITTTSIHIGRKDARNGEASLQGCRLRPKSGDGCEDDLMQIQLKLMTTN